MITRILSILMFIVGLFLIIIGIYMYNEKMVVGLVLTVLGAVFLFDSWGLWKGRRWAKLIHSFPWEWGRYT